MRQDKRSCEGDANRLVLSLIDDIYSAALDPGRWKGVVKRIVEAVGGISGQFTSPTEHVLTSSWAPCGFDPNFMGPYAQYYHALDVWTQAADATGQPPCRVFTGENLIDTEVFNRTEYYNDFLRPSDFGQIVCFFVDRAEEGNRPKTSLSIYRPPGSEPFGDDAVKFLGVLAPHVRRAVLLHWRIAELEHKNASHTEALEHLATGVALVDEALKVTYLNAAARFIVNAGDGLSVTGGELSAALGAETVELSRLLAETTRATVALDGSRTGTMAVTRRTSRMPYRITAIPVPVKGAFSAGRQHTAAIVFISGDNSGPQAGLGAVAEVYSLTPAEKRLLGALLNGAPLKRAARDLGISVNTAHTELQSIFRKTGTHRQVELVNLVAGVTGTNPPVKTRDDTKHS
jgi:DNA-binding CsgD family transcriptional regulator